MTADLLGLRLCFDGDPESKGEAKLEASIGKINRLRDPVPVIGADSENPTYRDVWLIGKNARHLPKGWKRHVVQLGDLCGLMNSSAKRLGEKTKVASGVVLEAAAALKSDLALRDSLDVVFICANLELIEGPRPPPPWLELTLRRLKLRGRVVVVDDALWQDVSASDADRDRLFPPSGERRSWNRLTERTCDFQILRVEEAPDRTPDAWRAVDTGAPVPLRASQVLYSGGGQTGPCRVAYAVSPGADTITEACDKTLEDHGFGPYACPAKQFMLIHVVQKEHSQVCIGDVWRRADLAPEVLRGVDPNDGVTQVITIDRFGRVTLVHHDDLERPLPVMTEMLSGAAGTEFDPEKALSGVYLGNVLFPNISRSYPVELSRLSFNAGPVDVTAEELSDTLSVQPTGVEPRLMALRNRLLLWHEALDRVTKLGFPDREDRRQELRGLLEGLPDFAALLEQLDNASRSGPGPRAKQEFERLLEQARTTVARRAEELKTELMTMVPPELSDLRAAISTINIEQLNEGLGKQRDQKS